jgi:GNAT superfamily N-acetyltransferase
MHKIDGKLSAVDMKVNPDEVEWQSFITELPFPRDMIEAERIYISSFPPEERMEWASLTSAVWDERGRIDLARYQSHVVGFAFTEHLNLAGYHFLSYLAVTNKLRGFGLGGWMLGKLCAAAEHDGRKGIIFDIEHPGATPREEVKQVRHHRVEFYLRHGAYLLSADWDYRVPLGHRYVRRHLMALPVNGYKAPCRAELSCIVTLIMTELYRLPTNDSNLQRMIKHFEHIQ